MGRRRLWTGRQSWQRRHLRKRLEVTAHLHDSADATRAELDHFVDSATGVQLLVIAELRIPTEDQEAIILHALQAPAVSILAVFLAVTPDETKFAVIALAAYKRELDRWQGGFPRAAKVWRRTHPISTTYLRPVGLVPGEPQLARLRPLARWLEARRPAPTDRRSTTGDDAGKARVRRDPEPQVR